MVATVRNRRAIISSVQPHDGPAGRLHLVDLEYNDGESPLAESLVWEREPAAKLLPASALPVVAGDPPMQDVDLDAMVRASRWVARTPFLDPDAAGPLDRLPISSPFHGAVQLEDYQLVPLLKALRMPRVSLLLADDVGLGKTIEAGLILSELLLRRRVRRVLVLTPASLRLQWRDELWQKFSLQFDVVDRDSTARLRRQLGMDANPWRSHGRILASYHYLKQPDVLEQFRAASQTRTGAPRLPWDLLIVDEAHNLTPAPFGDESDLCSMLRQIAPMFEHRLFLTATPHNGHTRSFTGLLEVLDPVRFSQSDEITPAQRERVEQVVIRRLKREINERLTPKRFCDRLPPQSLLIKLGAFEKNLSNAFAAFRSKVRSLIRAASRRRRLAGNFAIEILGKRLLSCPFAFAQSWHRCRQGMIETDDVQDVEVIAAQRTVAEDTADDQEAESRTQAATTTVGAWLRPMAADLTQEVEALDAAVKGLKLDKPMEEGNDPPMPVEDSRYVALLELIRTKLMDGTEWREGERLVVFTEYKTTLDYLVYRLRDDLEGEEFVLSLYGGGDMNDAKREAVKSAFNDPSSPVKILVATDAASEGLNLQQTARYLIHADVPWNPARLEQRNGRLDRHGQARDVTIWHYVSTEDDDLAFLSLVVHKVDTIREDLGATGEVFDELTHRRLIEGETLAGVQRDLDLRVDAARLLAAIPHDDQAGITQSSRDAVTVDLPAIAAELDFDADALRATLDAAMAIGAGRPRISEPDDEGRCAIVQPHPNGWAPVIDDSVRQSTRTGELGPLPKLTFDPQNFVININGRPLFRPKPNTLLMHLGHPMLQRALSALTRLRFPGTGATVSRWSVRRGSLPKGTDALIQLSVEELAVNELRETFHHWVRTVQLPVREERLGEALPHQTAKALRHPLATLNTDDIEPARDLWMQVEADIRQHLEDAAVSLTKQLAAQLNTDRDQALATENERYRSRQGEVSTLIESSTMARLDRELTELKSRRAQGLLFSQAEMLDEMDRNIERKQEELERRRQHYEEVRDQLAHERDRIINHLIPQRYAMRGQAQVLPVAVEIILPGGDA